MTAVVVQDAHRREVGEGPMEELGSSAEADSMPKDTAVECPRRAIVAMVRVRLGGRILHQLPPNPGQRRGTCDWCENGRRRINDGARAGVGKSDGC